MRAALLIPLALVLGACREWPEYGGMFRVPAALGVLHPEAGAPFTEPIGFIGNEQGGQIAPTLLKQGRYATVAPHASFLRANPLATGQQRVLAGLMPWADDDGSVTVYAFDRRFQQIVAAPFLLGFDASGEPVRPTTTVGEVRFVDADGSGDAPTLTELEIKTGWTPSETWEVRYDGHGWRVEGSRSGRMEGLALPGEPFIGVDRAVAFTIDGDATPGDHFLFTTDSGSVEYEAGGLPLEVRASPAHDVAAVVIQPTPDDPPELRLFDPRAPQAFFDAPPIALSADARPARLGWSADGRSLFVADRGAPAVWVLRWDDPDQRDDLRVQRIDLPWPVTDVAPVGDHALFLTPLGRDELWSYDVAQQMLRDANPWVDGTQGVRMDGPIRGIEAMHLPYLQLMENDDGVRRFARSAAVSLASGRVVFADEDSGCLVDDGFGPQTAITGQFLAARDFTRSYEGDAPFGATLQTNRANDRHVLANPCGGVTRTQTWTLTFDQIAQGWEVYGSVSGVMPSLAYEDQRYVSDDGEISFLIRSGSSISQDGWTITFRMAEGLTVADGSQGGPVGSRQVVLDQPSDPLYFHYQVGPRDGGWYRVDDRPHVLVAGQASNRVGRVDPQEGFIDVTWD